MVEPLSRNSLEQRFYGSMTYTRVVLQVSSSIFQPLNTWHGILEGRRVEIRSSALQEAARSILRVGTLPTYIHAQSGRRGLTFFPSVYINKAAIGTIDKAIRESCRFCFRCSCFHNKINQRLNYIPSRINERDDNQLAFPRAQGPDLSCEGNHVHLVVPVRRGEGLLK
jgi:hypothetical protein